MNLKEILAISGHSGLHKLVTQTRTGVIVESLIDGKRMPAYANSKISALEDIAIYTDADEVPLKQVFRTIFETHQGQPVLSGKPTNDQLKAFFASVLPNYDRERVYVSDMKRVASWYNLLLQKEIISAQAFQDNESAETQTQDQAEE